MPSDGLHNELHVARPPVTGKAPTIPQTPSTTINETLNRRFGTQPDNPAKAILGHFVCGVFTAINTLYKTLHANKPAHSHHIWMASCGAVSLAILVVLFLVYNIVMSLSFLVHWILYYGFILLGLFTVGLAVSGAMFFDKDASAQPNAYKRK